MRIYYFGCWDRPGHFLWLPSGSTTAGLSDLPRPDKPPHIYCPQLRDQPEGQARLTHIGMFTVLGWWDRSGDSRPGSHSELIARGHHTFEGMLTLGREHFPEVMARCEGKYQIRRA